MVEYDGVVLLNTVSAASCPHVAIQIKSHENKIKCKIQFPRSSGYQLRENHTCVTLRVSLECCTLGLSPAPPSPQTCMERPWKMRHHMEREATYRTEAPLLS